MRKKVGRFSSVAITVNALVVVLLICLGALRVEAWHAELSIDDLDPDTLANTAYRNDSEVLTNCFGIVVHNIGSQAMKISWMGIHFDWDPPLQQDMGGVWWGSWLGTEVIIPSGGFYEYDWVLFDVPSWVSVGSHSALVGIEVADPASGSDWGTPSRSYEQFTVYVVTQTDDAPVNPSPDNPRWEFALGVLVVGASFLAVLLLITYRRSRKV